MVVLVMKKKMMRQTYKVKWMEFMFGSGKGIWAVVGLCLLWSGCASEPIGNKRMYDRYASLLAEQRNQPSVQQEQPSNPVVPTSDRGVSASTRQPLKTEAKQSSPVVPIQPAPEKSTPRLQPVKQPESAPEPAPVQIIPAPPKATPTPQPSPVAESDNTDTDGVDVQTDESDVSAYVLKEGDVVQVALRGIPGAEGIEVVIDEYGLISLPYINEIQAAGKTASGLARSIRQIYQDRKIYQDVSVTINVPTRFYFTQGEIRSPGKFQMVSSVRISEAIAASGGYTDFASGMVDILRNGKIYKTVNAKRLHRTPADDIVLEPGDIVLARRSFF